MHQSSTLVAFAALNFSVEGPAINMARHPLLRRIRAGFGGSIHMYLLWALWYLKRIWAHKTSKNVFKPASGMFVCQSSEGSVMRSLLEGSVHDVRALDPCLRTATGQRVSLVGSMKHSIRGLQRGPIENLVASGF